MVITLAGLKQLSTSIFDVTKDVKQVLKYVKDFMIPKDVILTHFLRKQRQCCETIISVSCNILEAFYWLPVDGSLEPDGIWLALLVL